MNFETRRAATTGFRPVNCVRFFEKLEAYRTLAITFFVATLLTSLLATHAFGQVSQEPPFDRTDLLESQIVALTLPPAKESVPVLKHHLVLEPSEMLDRNSVIYYHRAMHLDQDIRDSFNYDTDSFHEWLNETPSELQLKKVKTWLDRNKTIFHELDKASRCSHTDWGLQPTEFDIEPWYVLPINEIPYTRRFVRMLSVKALSLIHI